jgi:hypothetical protein
MNTFALEIWYDEGSICTFYTVKWIDDDIETDSETDKFFDKFALPGHFYEESALQLFRLISEAIGNKYGAIDDFFDRAENLAQALPPKPKIRVEEVKKIGINFPLRLFCYRITNQIVVLFNGGIKDENTAQTSKLSMKFYEAQLFSKRIADAFQSGIIEISNNGRYLQNFDGTTDLIL